MRSRTNPHGRRRIGSRFQDHGIAPSRRRCHKGFTLIELLAVLAIIGILTGIAAPHFSSAVSNQRLDAAAHRVAKDLALARSWARSGSTPHKVGFDVSANRYSIKRWEWSEVQGEYTWRDVPGLKHSAGPYTLSLAEPPYEADLLSVDFNGKLEITFDGYGSPDQGGTITLKYGLRQKTVTLESTTGQVSIE